MELEKFLSYLKKTKKSNKETAQIFSRCFSSGGSDFRIILANDSSKGIRVVFKRLHSPTVFEANMLLMVFAMGRCPIDYARYHKCISGKQFIENISSIYVMRQVEKYEFMEVE
jgi:hypothetical protein